MEKRMIDWDSVRIPCSARVCDECWLAARAGDRPSVCVKEECPRWNDLEVPDIDNMTDAIKYQKLPQVCDICGERFLWKESEHVCQDCNEVRK